MKRIRNLGTALSLVTAVVALCPEAFAQSQPEGLPPLPAPGATATQSPPAAPAAWGVPRKPMQFGATTTTTTTTTSQPAPGASAPAAAPPPAAPVEVPPSRAASASTPGTAAAVSDGDRARGAQSMKVTFESSQSAAAPAAADQAAAEPAKRSPDESKILHGFRIGYSHTFNYDKPLAQFGAGGDCAAPGACVSLKDKIGLKAPDHLLLGYEVIYRVVGQSWLNVLLVGNANIAGLEQSKALPTGNLLIGFEFNNAFQLGVGANLAPLKGAEAHAIVAAGWTPKVGTLYTPLHVFFIPDADGVHRMGVTTGVTF
jgi:hypothetical protein